MSNASIEWNSISVDAACSGNPGRLEYRGVETENKNEIFHVGPLDEGTNNVGEFLALVHALAMLKKRGDSTTPVYSDSRIAMGWVKKKKANTKLKQTYRNERLFDLLERGEEWLASNTYKTRILKWETKKWGEIPADFGRK
jgi:ribonuclease HI